MVLLMRMPLTIASLSVLLIAIVPFPYVCVRSASAAGSDGLADQVRPEPVQKSGSRTALAWSDLPDPGPRAEPHLTEAADLHLAATLGGSMPIEFPTGEHEVSLLTTPISAREGWVEVPDGPGLGVEVNEEAIRRYPYAVAAGQPFLLH